MGGKINMPPETSSTPTKKSNGSATGGAHVRQFGSFSEASSFLWSIADLLRGDYKQYDYGKVILPFTVLRRLVVSLLMRQSFRLVPQEDKNGCGIACVASILGMDYGVVRDLLGRPSGMLSGSKLHKLVEKRKKGKKVRYRRRLWKSVEKGDIKSAHWHGSSRQPLHCLDEQGVDGPLVEQVALASEG